MPSKTSDAIVLDTHAGIDIAVEARRFSRQTMRAVDSSCGSGLLFVAAITA